MRRTVMTSLLVSAVAVSAALALGAAVGLTATGAAQSTPDADHHGENRSADDARIAYFSVAGRGYVADQETLVEDHPGPTYVWASESLVLRPTVHTQPNGRTKRACGYLLDGDREPIESVGCHAWNSTTRQRWARIEFAGWPAETNGTRFVRIELQEEVPRTASDGNGTETVLRDTHEAEVTVVTKQGDLDEDGLSNAREVEVGTDFTRRDTDGDGVSDRAEVYRHDSDPTAADSTGDGVDDGTVASLRLPPTVPYVVHVAVAAGLLGAVGLAAAGVALRRRLRTEHDGPPPAGSRTVAADGSAEEPDRFVDTKEGEILGVLREHDGQMRQTDLVDETEWSKATVSRLLSTLEEEGRVEKIRVGRGNVVRLVGPDATGTGVRSQASG